MLFAQPDPVTWMQLADRYGIPLVLLFAFLVVTGVVIWKVTRWAKPYIERAIEANITLMSTLTVNSNRQAEVAEKQAADMAEVREQMGSIASSQTSLSSSQNSLSTAQNRCADNIDKLVAVASKIIGAVSSTNATLKAVAAKAGTVVDAVAEKAGGDSEFVVRSNAQTAESLAEAHEKLKEISHENPAG